MASHPLIDGYLATLANHLPAETVDELADGLAETYARHRQHGLPPDTAADAATAEFGAPDLVLAAFVQQAPGRRIARALLASGPAVGACWALTLVTGQAWSQSIPIPYRLTAGLVLLATVSALAVAATSRRSYRRTRWTAPAAGLLLTLDLVAITATVAFAPAFTGLTWLAVTASLARIALTARVGVRLLVH
jgi:hypothetical protein